MRMCLSPTTVTSGHGLILMITASEPAFGLESLGTFSWVAVCYLTGWLLIDIVIFWKTALPMLLEDVPLALRQRWFQHDGTPAPCGEDIWQWLNAGRLYGPTGCQI
jgi:hypothetical protein